MHRFGDTYRMYYWGTDADGHHSILAAESPVASPNDWKPLGVVLGRQPDTSYNNAGPTFAYVVPRKHDPWLMYVCTEGEGGYPACWSTYLAVSRDQGATWQYEGDEPVLPHTRSWNSKATGSVCVLREGSLWRIYYTSFGDQGLDWVGIGYAESRDGVHWTYPVDHLVVAPRGDAVTPREKLCSKPWVIKEDGGYRMWVGARGSEYRLRALTSADGIHWNWETDGRYYDDHRLLGGVGPAGAFDDHKRSYASVIRQGDEYLFWYTGNDYGMTGMGFAPAASSARDVGRSRGGDDNPKTARRSNARTTSSALSVVTLRDSPSPIRAEAQCPGLVRVQ